MSNRKVGLGGVIVVVIVVMELIVNRNVKNVKMLGRLSGCIDVKMFGRLSDSVGVMLGRLSGSKSPK